MRISEKRELHRREKTDDKDRPHASDRQLCQAWLRATLRVHVRKPLEDRE